MAPRKNVAEIADCARACWTIENEGFNVLKNDDYHLEHNFGHGQKHLCRVPPLRRGHTLPRCSPP